MSFAPLIGGDISARSGARIPTAIQQHLDWTPTVGRVFRTADDFTWLLAAYQFATGKRYVRLPKKNMSRKYSVLTCSGCRRGRVEIHNIRTSQDSHWKLMVVELCECNGAGVPTALTSLKEEGVLSLANRAEVVQVKDWQLLASACFPGGYSSSGIGKSVVLRPCRCLRDGCPGMIELRLKRVGNKLDPEGPVHVERVVECSQICKEMGQSVKQAIQAPDPPSEEICCELFYDAEVASAWYQFTCGKHVCGECLCKLVGTCPQAIARSGSGLVVFHPENQPEHCHICPYCRQMYYPSTTLVRFTKSTSNGVESWLEEEVRLDSVIPTAFAYQCFSDNFASVRTRGISISAEQLKMAKDLPAALTTDQFYDTAAPLFRLYKQGVANARQMADPLETVLAVVRAVETGGYERLGILRQSSLFRRHTHPVLNFLDAVETLHDHGLDYGYLQRVADATDANERRRLVNEAYVNGFNGHGAVNYQVVVALLVRKHLVEVLSVD